MTSDQASRTAGFHVHGRVQGVGFRWWTRRTAERLGVSGWVRNLPDGRVEIHAAAEPAVLAEFAARLERGPRSASVRRIERFSIDETPGSGFVIEP